MKQELNEIKERLAKMEVFFKKPAKTKYGVSVASCVTTADMSYSIEKDGEEEPVYLDDVVGLRSELQWLNERISNLWQSLYEHTDTGHLPPIIGASKLKEILDVLGLSGDYQVQPKTVYASVGGEQTGLVLTISKQTEEVK